MTLLSKISLSGRVDSWVNYSVTIPAGKSTLTVTMSGGTGDADLFVRDGAEPTSYQYDCRPYETGNDEICTLEVSAGGTVYLSIEAFEAYSGVSLKAVAE